MTRSEAMLRELAGTLLAGAATQPPDAPIGDPLTSALIGTGATLAMTRGRRAVGVVLLAAGGWLALRDLWQSRAAATLSPPAPGRPVPSPRPVATAAAA